MDFSHLEIWFITGSQHLYGDETLQLVGADSQKIVDGLNTSGSFPARLVFKPVLTTSDAIRDLCVEANAAKHCIGLVAWMHTFSPAKMWIGGLKALQKPFAHLHTQFNRDIPWSEIDMDFMNLNQSAHGGREFGFIGTRMRRGRKVITGYWQDRAVQHRLAVWMRAALAWHDMQGAKVARFGDNMRNVAVTEGDKVEAEIQLGFATNGYGIGDLVSFVDDVADDTVDTLINQYEETYHVADDLKNAGTKRQSLREAARIELGMRAFLENGGFTAFTTTFENLYGLPQLPGLAVQRLMADGYGFGAEGDWKTAAIVRAMKVMGAGNQGGCSFMEDYTYHLKPGDMKVLGAHMLEVCPSIGKAAPRLEVHPLDIGGKPDPVRLVFDVATGPAVNASLIDMGTRFRMIVNPVEVVDADEPLPKLPVARALWKPQPDLQTSATAWILAGAAHHSGFSQAVTAEHLEDFAEMAGIECLLIDQDTTIREFKKELRWNEVYYHLAKGV